MASASVVAMDHRSIIFCSPEMRCFTVNPESRFCNELKVEDTPTKYKSKKIQKNGSLFFVSPRILHLHHQLYGDFPPLDGGRNRA